METRFSYAIEEVISHTGIPQELLTDQDSIFVGTLARPVCDLLSIKKIRTSAYHQQGNGTLERWHASLKGMTRKLGSEVREWDKALKFCLLCYQGTPHTATGFSLFELVHGYPMRGPLEAIKNGWLEGELSFTNSVKWVDLRKTFSILHEQARKCEGKYETTAKQYYDKNAKNGSFKQGDMVLLHGPTSTG